MTQGEYQREQARVAAEVFGHYGLVVRLVHEEFQQGREPCQWKFDELRAWTRIICGIVEAMEGCTRDEGPSAK